MRRALALAALITLVVAPLRADEPKINGPDKVEPYKIVRLTVTGLDTKAGTLWKVRDAAGKPIDAAGYGQAGKRNLRSVEFVAPPGVYSVELTVVSKGVTDADPFSLDELTKLVTIGVPPPIPPAPGPQPVPPTPDPTPPVPAPGTGAFVIVIVDEQNPTMAQHEVANGVTLAALKMAGKCRVYGNVSDSDKLKAQKYDKMMADKALSAPALFVLDKAGKVVLASKLPTSDAATQTALKGVLAP